MVLKRQLSLQKSTNALHRTVKQQGKELRLLKSGTPSICSSICSTPDITDISEDHNLSINQTKVKSSDPVSKVVLF